MLTEKSLNIFFKEIANQRDKILSEDLHLPHGTKSAKVVTHTDLDGIVSGISMFQQLVKQGMPKERITVEFAQYGDEKDDKNFKDRFIGRKGEYVGVTDFAKLPKVKPFDTWNKLFSFKGDPNALINILCSQVPDFKTFKANLLKQVKKTQWTDGNIQEIYDAQKAYKSLKKLHEKNKNIVFEEANISNIRKLEFPLITPDFVSDHHNNDQGALSGGQRGEIAAKSPSEAEFFANKYSNGMWSQEDLKAISMVDSAAYTEAELKNTIFLEKHFSGPDRKRNLATITACVYDGLCKRDRSAAAWIAKNAQPTLISLYNTTLKAAGYNGKRLEYVSALKNGDVEKAKQLLSELPAELNKRYDRRGNPEKPVLSLQDWQKKNKKDIDNMKTGYKTEADKKKLEEIKGKRGAEYKEIRDAISSKKGKIISAANFAIFNGTDWKTQYSRYSATLYSKNGQRQPFSLRYWREMFQISKSPLYKGEVDFSKVNDHVIEDVRNFLNDEGCNGDKIAAFMKEKNGGHAGGIWTFNGFDQIKPPSKDLSQKYWTAVKLLKKKPDSELANKIVNDYKPITDKYKDIKKKCMRLAMNSATRWTNKLCPVSKENLDALKTDDKDLNED